MIRRLAIWRRAAVLAGLFAAGTAGVAGADSAPGVTAAPDGTLPVVFNDRQALDLSQDAIGGRLGDHRFADHKGRSVRLSEFRGKPLVVSLIYTSCYQTCPLTTANLARAVAAADRVTGPGAYRVVTIGFNTAFDTPEHMAAFAHGQGVDRAGWLMLSTDAPTIQRIGAELGFTWFASPRGFDHLVQTSILDAEGRVYRQLYGTDITAPALLTALTELTSGQPVVFKKSDGWFDRLQLLCSVYDPTRGRYRVSYALLISTLIGGTSLAGVGIFLIRAWRNAPRHDRRASAGPGQSRSKLS
ncbi:MAG: SCO family protein [Rhodospirillaceae bacterium]